MEDKQGSRITNQIETLRLGFEVKLLVTIWGGKERKLWQRKVENG